MLIFFLSRILSIVEYRVDIELNNLKHKKRMKYIFINL